VREKSITLNPGVSEERPHQGKGHVVLMPEAYGSQREGPIRCRGWLGRLLKYYRRSAA
jgi:hypothetical protein